jgi:phosphatidate cytidylyltransferase
MLKQRVITALILAAIVFGALFLLPTLAWGVFALAMLLVAAHEWARLCAWSKVVEALFLLLLGGAAAGLLAFAGPQSTLFAEVAKAFGLAALAFWMLLAPLWLLRGWKLAPAPLMFLLGILLLFATWIALVLLQGHSPWFVVGALALVAAADIAAYFTGRAFGRHKLAPAISPGKTWEGVMGAVVGVLIYAAALLPLAGRGGFATPLATGAIALWLVFALGLTALAIEGDLLESWLKRLAGVKDSGNLLPGHGGVLDRIDALLPTMPALALFVQRFTL